MVEGSDQGQVAADTPGGGSTFRNRRPSAKYDHSEEQVLALKNYILDRGEFLDTDLLPFGDPAGKDVLVFGSGFGNEVLWAVRRGAKSVLALDISPALSSIPFEAALEELGIEYTDFEFRRENVIDTALTGDTFDLIMSVGVFEHVFDLKGVLSSFRTLLNPEGRVAIYADGLWYSSIGGHMHRGPWEHMYTSPAEFKEELTDAQWGIYRDQLNRMTAADFLDAIRASGMVIRKMELRGDPNIDRLGTYLPYIRRQSDISPADLSVVAIGCELCFVENLVDPLRQDKSADETDVGSGS